MIVLSGAGVSAGLAVITFGVVMILRITCSTGQLDQSTLGHPALARVSC